jgi:hypothetical protein
MKNKKPFKETKVGKFLSKVAPNILDTVGDVLPDKGLLGVVKNLIDKDNSMSLDDKEMAHSHLKELYALEVSDRQSARKREVEVRKEGVDWMFVLTGVIGLASFSYLVYTIINIEVPEANKELFIHLIGIVEGVALSIFSYYFGQSIIKNK